METQTPTDKNLSVLVVDDEDAMRYGLARELRKCQCIVNESESVESALSELNTSRYDIIFCDMRFPGGKDGDELLEIAATEYPDTQIVIVSCSMDPKQKTELVAKGAALCLQKPVFKDQCLEAIQFLKDNSDHSAT